MTFLGGVCYKYFSHKSDKNMAFIKQITTLEKL